MTIILYKDSVVDEPQHNKTQQRRKLLEEFESSLLDTCTAKLTEALKETSCFRALGIVPRPKKFVFQNRKGCVETTSMDGIFATQFLQFIVESEHDPRHE